MSLKVPRTPTEESGVEEGPGGVEQGVRRHDGRRNREEGDQRVQAASQVRDRGALKGSGPGAEESKGRSRWAGSDGRRDWKKRATKPAR